MPRFGIDNKLLRKALNDTRNDRINEKGKYQKEIWKGKELGDGSKIDQAAVKGAMELKRNERMSKKLSSWLPKSK